MLPRAILHAMADPSSGLRGIGKCSKGFLSLPSVADGSGMMES